MLRTAREQGGILQQAAADHLGMGIRTLRNIESGTAEISVRDLFKAAELYKTTVQKLLRLEENSVTDSFNQMRKQSGNIVHGDGNNITIDRIYMEETNKRFAFLEQQIEHLQEEKRNLENRK